MFPMYYELVRIARENPIPRPDIEKYWQEVLKLDVEQMEIIVAIAESYRQQTNQKLPDLIRSLPGNKGVTVMVDQAPSELQQLIFHYLNRV